jgi:hypothetical protein
MQEAQANLQQAAIELVTAAEGVAAKAAQVSADPLDHVDTDVLELGELEPVLSATELAEMKDRLARQRLVPEAVLELVDLARQVAAVLTDNKV